jgi:diaminopimelate epimerase
MMCVFMTRSFSENFPSSVCFSLKGCGNAIALVDLRTSSYLFTEKDVILLNASVAFDQLMVIHRPRVPEADVFLRVYNVDGSEVGMCGNGLRCVGKVLMQGTPHTSMTFETTSGLFICARISDKDFCVDMGSPQFGWKDIPLAHEVPDPRDIVFHESNLLNVSLGAGFALSMGNPHVVFFVSDVDAYDLLSLGPILENHPLFPQRVNVSLCVVKDPTHLDLRVWERGAGQTQACGSGACAASVAAICKGFADRHVTVSQTGGVLTINWREIDDHVLMSGPVVYCGAHSVPEAVAMKF